MLGGGFYGACLASYLVRRRGMTAVRLVERESSLLSRASYRNQARVHNGYHYPRSFTTAFRSRVNLPRFIADWPDAVKTDFTALYAIARRNSKVTTRQFLNFCRLIGASVEQPSSSIRGLFDSRLIESLFEVQECAFDASVLAEWARWELDDCGVDVQLNTHADAVHAAPGNRILVGTMGVNGTVEQLRSDVVFNCTYAGLNQLGGDFGGVRTGLKQEITEIALLDMPTVLGDLGVTVMDGPFYSLMPFPARGLHSFSHVRYTPHVQWVDQRGLDPYSKLDGYEGSSRASWMLRDVVRYMPAIREARYVESAFEVKTVLVKNEYDDGRPILFEKHAELPGLYSVLGGKIDNIYDVLERLDQEDL